jgi:hypothetical protein
MSSVLISKAFSAFEGLLWVELWGSIVASRTTAIGASSSFEHGDGRSPPSGLSAVALVDTDLPMNSLRKRARPFRKRGGVRRQISGDLISRGARVAHRRNLRKTRRTCDQEKEQQSFFNNLLVIGGRAKVVPAGTKRYRLRRFSSNDHLSNIWTGGEGRHGFL